MANDPYAIDEAPPGWRRRASRVLALLLVGFALGTVAAGWLLGRFEALDLLARRAAGRTEAVRTIVVAPPRAVAPPLPTPAADVAAATALAGRLETLSRRLDTIDARARAATGDADRAEGLLVAFAARRALDRGVDLGYIEGLLRERFATSQPQAVAAIIAAARQPVTLASLGAELDRVAPELTGHVPNESWWHRARRELAGMIVVRRADAPPTAPPERIERARRALESGQADVALAEIARIPGNGAAVPWMTAARRYVSSRAALDRIETAALLEPHVDDGPAPDGPPADADADADAGADADGAPVAGGDLPRPSATAAPLRPSAPASSKPAAKPASSADKASSDRKPPAEKKPQPDSTRR